MRGWGLKSKVFRYSYFCGIVSFKTPGIALLYKMKNMCDGKNWPIFVLKKIWFARENVHQIIFSYKQNRTEFFDEIL